MRGRDQLVAGSQVAVLTGRDHHAERRRLCRAGSSSSAGSRASGSPIWLDAADRIDGVGESIHGRTDGVDRAGGILG